MDKTILYRIINGLIFSNSLGILVFAYYKNRNRLINIEPLRNSNVWERSIAILIDLTIISIIFICIPFVPFIPKNVFESPIWIEGLSIITFSWLYFSILESSKFQGSIEKLCAGFQVVDYNGKRITFIKASIRFFAKFISFYSFFIGFLIFPFTKLKQASHDMISKTVVVNKAYN